jgi:hypothetical protein
MQVAVQKLYSLIICYFQRMLDWYEANRFMHAWKAFTQPYSLRYRDLESQVKEVARSIQSLAAILSQQEIHQVHEQMQVLPTRLAGSEQNILARQAASERDILARQAASEQYILARMAVFEQNQQSLAQQIQIQIPSTRLAGSEQTISARLAASEQDQQRLMSRLQALLVKVDSKWPPSVACSGKAHPRTAHQSINSGVLLTIQSTTRDLQTANMISLAFTDGFQDPSDVMRKRLAVSQKREKRGRLRLGYVWNASALVSWSTTAKS